MQVVAAVLCDSVTLNKNDKDGGAAMLILTRRVGESLVIGDDVDVTVLGMRGNQVRLGVTAPREISVHREEIYQRIHDDKENGGASAHVHEAAAAD